MLRSAVNMSMAALRTKSPLSIAVALGSAKRAATLAKPFPGLAVDTALAIDVSDTAPVLAAIRALASVRTTSPSAPHVRKTTFALVLARPGVSGAQFGAGQLIGVFSRNCVGV